LLIAIAQLSQGCGGGCKLTVRFDFPDVGWSQRRGKPGRPALLLSSAGVASAAEIYKFPPARRERSALTARMIAGVPGFAIC